MVLVPGTNRLLMVAAWEAAEAKARPAIAAAKAVVTNFACFMMCSLSKNFGVMPV